MSAVKVENISKVYKLYDSPTSRLKEALHPFRKKYHHDFYALKDVNFEVEEGETLGIIGKNGSGKSTLLKIITNVLTPTGGTVTMKGKISALLELGAGFNPEFTGIENIYLHSSIMGYSKQEIDEKLDEIMTFADIGDFVYQPIKTYSSGMLVRLAFAVAITVDPDVLIIDEALTVGDVAFQRKCFSKMAKFAEAGKTILFVSHSPETIIAMCHRAILLDSGEKILEGSPKHVTKSYLQLINTPHDKYFSLREHLKDLSFDMNYNQANNAELSEQESHNSEHPQDDKAFYVPGFKPQSTYIYEPRGVMINDVKMMALDGRVVNYLAHNHRYIYTYQVRFLEGFQKVSFGMGFRTNTGLILGGANYIKAIERRSDYSKGEQVSVRYHFDCILNEGTYFTQCGVHTNDEQGNLIFLHRIVDATIFTVLPEKHSISDGMIDFNIAMEVTPIETL